MKDVQILRLPMCGSKNQERHVPMNAIPVPPRAIPYDADGLIPA